MGGGAIAPVLLSGYVTDCDKTHLHTRPAVYTFVRPTIYMYTVVQL